MDKNEKTYCSLDIETSGFDPLTNEILEVGFVMFKVQGPRFKVLEEWTQVFKPSKPVVPQILGLTGITQNELDEAPAFSEYQAFLQKKLGDATIVGHNVVFDIKFLEAFGIKFTGEVVDTLDLVQFLLPTHHSYNLENLMHTFGISHKDAHRALADSKATLKLLENLLRVFAGFSDKLKLSIKKLIKNLNFPWQSLLDSEFPVLKFNDLLKEKPLDLSVLPTVDFKFESKTVNALPISYDFIYTLAADLKKSKKEYLLVVPKTQQVLELYRNKFIDDALFLPEHQFDKKKFNALIKRKNQTAEEVKFILKILVWQETNWQSETILDLNLSFFGGQFKSLIIGGKVNKQRNASVLGCNHSVFLELSNSGLYKERQVIICGLNDFEGSITKDLGAKISWGYINYLLKTFYNFDLNIGQDKFMKPTEQALADTDLFFGLVSALLQTDPPSFQYFKITPETLNQDNYQKIKSAAENYQNKLSSLNKIFESEAVTKFVDDLRSFFEVEDNRVKWLEISENRCALLSMPVQISGLVKDLLKPFDKISFADSLGAESLFKFFIQRLGITDFKLRLFEYKVGKNSKSSNSKQGDLFSLFKKALGQKKHKVFYHSIGKAFDANEILDLLRKDNAFPGAVLFPNLTAVREFYDQNYQSLKQGASVLAQSNSGGSNKIFRNFSINPKSLLLATDKLILKHLSTSAAVEQVLKLPVKTLVICRLPFEQFTHPYQEAISQSLPNSFMDYALPKALFNFYSLLEFFNTPELENIYTIDAKLNKDYASVFKEYYKHIPNAENII
jgi:DNA polymerase III epsilon subunit-like protein